MPDQIPSFEQTLDADLQSLAAEIKNGKEHADVANSTEKEMVKEAMGRVFPKLVPATQPAGTPQAPAAPSAGPLPDYAASAAPEVKLEIENLLGIAFKKGIAQALTESKKSPYFVQDAFHDALAGKLYPELQKRGLVE